MADVYQQVTDKIIAALETALKWEKPWTSAFSAGNGSLSRPINAISKKGYRGINVPLLWTAQRSTNVWATYKQWQELGAQVRKGERANMIVFYKQMTARAEGAEDAGDGKTYMLARAYSVFNADQVDGYGTEPVNPAAPVAPVFDPVAAADEFVARTGAVIRHGGDQAFYSPATDHISMPQRSQFVGTKTSSAAETYYSTLFHELTHWTRHKSRLDRDFGRKRWGDAGYAAEELVAELGAAYLSADMLLCHEPRADHAAYVANWLKVLRNDKRAIFTAASCADKACAFLAGKQEEAPAMAAE